MAIAAPGGGPPVHNLFFCSIFMHSHLRPFHYAAASRSIQTCSLPGAWLLLGHEDLVVEVEGTAENPSSMDTQLTMVTNHCIDMHVGM